MKTTTIISLLLFVSASLFAQDITNTLGGSGTFTVNDGTDDVITATSSTVKLKSGSTDRIEVDNNGSIFSGGQTVSVTTIASGDFSSNIYTVSKDEFVIIVTSQDDACTITLPLATLNPGRMYYVKQANGINLDLTVNVSDNNADYSFRKNQGGAICTVSDGTVWRLLIETYEINGLNDVVE